MLLDFLVRDFIQIIRKIECSTGYPIKILALDFDCTLIPFHTGGSYQIYDQDGNFKNDLLKIFFPNPDFIHLLVTKLRENGIQPAIASHSDPRFNDKDKGLIGGQKLILSLLKRLFPNDNIFNVKNVIAYSNPYNGTFTNKNMHIKQLVDNYNQNGMNQNYGWNKQCTMKNVLLIDDSFNNISGALGHHGLYSNFLETSLSLGCKIEFMKIYLEHLNKQVDTQIRYKYGFVIKNDQQPFHININYNHNIKPSSRTNSKIDIVKKKIDDDEDRLNLKRTQIIQG